MNLDPSKLMETMKEQRLLNLDLTEQLLGRVVFAVRDRLRASLEQNPGIRFVCHKGMKSNTVLIFDIDTGRALQLKEYREAAIVYLMTLLEEEPTTLKEVIAEKGLPWFITDEEIELDTTLGLISPDVMAQAVVGAMHYSLLMTVGDSFFDKPEKYPGLVGITRDINEYMRGGDVFRFTNQEQPS